MKLVSKKAISPLPAISCAFLNGGCGKEDVSTNNDMRLVYRKAMQIQYGAGNNRPRFIDITHKQELTSAEDNTVKGLVDIVGFVSFGEAFKHAPNKQDE